jgi:beta-D-xylosidase 4
MQHAAAYQVETNRFAIDETISDVDLAEFFYAQWQAVTEAGVAGFMCAYPAINGVPCCGSVELETNLFRGAWGLGNATRNGSYIQADCGAIEYISSAHHVAPNTTDAAAMALNSGTDIDCGSTYQSELISAITNGLTNVTMLDASLRRTFTLQFLTGTWG